MDLRQPGKPTNDLFAASQPVAAEKEMEVLGGINARWGKVRFSRRVGRWARNGRCGGIDEAKLYDTIG